jgi:hypothetical protein
MRYLTGSSAYANSGLVKRGVMCCGQFKPEQDRALDLGFVARRREALRQIAVVLQVSQFRVRVDLETPAVRVGAHSRSLTIVRDAIPTRIPAPRIIPASSTCSGLSICWIATNTTVKPERTAAYARLPSSILRRTRIYGSRPAHGVFEALRRDGKRVIAKFPFMSSYAALLPEYGALLDG